MRCSQSRLRHNHGGKPLNRSKKLFKQTEPALSARADAMILFNPVLDLGPGNWGHRRAGAQYRELSPARNVSSDDAPSIVLVGSNDRIVRIETVCEFEKAMQQAGVKAIVRLFSGEEHGFFNYRRGKNYAYYDTLWLADEFLQALGWFTGPARLTMPTGLERNHPVQGCQN